MKKIMICYASYGGGHLSAAKNIKEYIDENYSDCDVYLFDSMKYINKIIDKICGSTYSIITKNAPWFWGKVYYGTQNKTFGKILAVSNKILAYKLNKILKDFKPEIIISTHFFIGHMCGILKKNGKIDCKLINIITDYGNEPYNEWIANHEYLDYIFVAHENMRNKLIEKGVSENKLFATGIPISSKFLLNYNKENILKELEFSSDKKTILFFAGGEFGLGKNRTIKLFEKIVKNFKDTQIIAVSGKNESIKNAFENIVQENNRNYNIKVFEFTNRVAEFMSISDLVVTKPGGLTSTESLVSGLPMLIVNPIPGQEIENAEFLESNGAAIWLKKKDDITVVLNDLLNNPDKLSSMKENIKKIAKPNSTKDICKMLLN